ncbi:YibE/F family protein [Paraliobacillus sp. JSM ZJ581]|uniref:YibE/F family protein n=1 Tax=Paraliobacillus sp. JSM ZJ581 TaxID=3342118 RepID=UPI0035A86D73
MNKYKRVRIHIEKKQWVSWGILLLLCLGSLFFVNHNATFYNKPIAEVTEIIDVKQVDVTDSKQNHDVVYTQLLDATLKNGEQKGSRIELTNEYSDSRAYHPKLSSGDEVFVSVQETNSGDLVGSIADIKRDEALLVVAWIFIFVLLAVGSKQGLFAMISLIINAVIIAYALHLYIDTSSVSLLFIMSGAVVVMSILSLLFVSGFHAQTYAAIISTLLGTFMLLFITMYVLSVTNAQGLRFEEMSFLSRPPQAIFMAGVLVGALGAVMDIGVSMASSLFSLYEKNNDISIKDLRESGIEIGKDIMGTMTNILFFAYVSGTIPSLLLYLMNDASLGFTLSMNLSLELTRALAGGIGIVLTIPIGLYVTILFIRWKQVKS